jgi:hypothetical protein
MNKVIRWCRTTEPDIEKAPLDTENKTQNPNDQKRKIGDHIQCVGHSYKKNPDDKIKQKICKYSEKVKKKKKKKKKDGKFRVPRKLRISA